MLDSRLGSFFLAVQRGQLRYAWTESLVADHIPRIFIYNSSLEYQLDEMVRSKTLNVLSGRKQRIEGIVKNLSAKVKTKGLTSATNGSGKSDPLAALFQPRTESQYTATTTRNDSADSGKYPSKD